MQREMIPTEVLLVVLPFAAAFIMSMLFAPGVISALRRRNVGQTISADGPESHRPKAGTPTMGGLIILAGVLAGALVTALIFTSKSGFGGVGGSDVMVQDLLAVLLLMVAFGLLGMADDYLTIHPVADVRGIASRPKAMVQILLAIAFVIWISSHRPGGFLPVLSFGPVPLLGGITYWIFAVIFIVGMANFVNITDGLDGLVSGLTAIAGTAFVLTVLLIPPHLGFQSATLLALSMAIAGACIAFLWFNANPAKVFMGDTGALALGAGLPAIAILTHREFLMIVVGLVFVLDGLSTALQWAVFKITRIATGEGRRVFKKSPIHHHFELSGWPEQAIVVRFWIAGVIAALIAFAGAAWGLW